MKHSRWVEVETSTIYLADGQTIQALVNGLSLDGKSGYVHVGGRDIQVLLQVDGEWHEKPLKCILCGQVATSRMAYGAVIRSRREICFVLHCHRHASPHDETLSTLRDVQSITSKALANALDVEVREQAQRELAGLVTLGTGGGWR